MKIKRILLFAILMGSVLASCKDDDKDDDTAVRDDARVRAVNIDGISHTFVINDVEGIIYNYDSLSYGTNVEKLRPVFYGYGESLTIQYMDGGEWTAYDNSLSSGTDTIDFRSPVRIKSIAPDASYTKEYSMEVRVHKYDVEAISWQRSGAQVPVRGEVASFKTVYQEGMYYLFYSNQGGESYVLVSADGDSWTEKTVGGIAAGTDWSTLVTMSGDGFAVKGGNDLYTSSLPSENDFSLSAATLPGGAELSLPLFTLDNNFWVIGKLGEEYYLYSLASGAPEFQQGTALSARVPDLPFTNVTPMVANSGTTTLGYIFGDEIGGNGVVWAVDISGNIVNISGNNSGLPALDGPMPFTFDNKLYLARGSDNRQLNGIEFYGSSNSGIRWSADTHKILPDGAEGLAGGFVFEYRKNYLILIGGRNASGFQPYVWKGRLNQDYLDEIINQ